MLEDGESREREGIAGASTGIWATSLHGIFESDGLWRSFLRAVVDRRGKHFATTGANFESRRQAEIDRAADALEAHLDLEAILAIIAKGAPR